MLNKSPDTKFLDWKVQNSRVHLAEIKARLPFVQFRNTKRMVCTLGKSYSYSGQTSVGNSFDLYPPIFKLMDKLNKKLKTNFNSVLINWYPKGANVGIGKHSDSEDSLVPNQPVASISLGCKCDFVLESWDKTEKVVVELKDSDVFVMGINCQKFYGHSINYTKMEEDRISLTFRKFK